MVEKKEITAIEVACCYPVFAVGGDFSK